MAGKFIRESIISPELQKASEDLAAKWMPRTVIYKYPLYEIGKPTEIGMPVGTKILTAQLQGATLTLWALHPFKHGEQSRLQSRKIFVTGTGHENEYQIDAMRHISTLQIGALVWHVFEIIELGRFDPAQEI